MPSETFTIVAIDDNADNLTSLGALVREAFPKARYVTARQGAQGIQLARQEKPSVILLDILMPGMDGYMVCQSIRQDTELKHIPVIFLTALRSDAENRARALDAGGDGFLTKPVDPLELTAQVRTMLKVYASTSAQQKDKAALSDMVKEHTRELQRELAVRQAAEEKLKSALEKVTTSQTALLNILEDLKAENEARVHSEQAMRDSELKFRSIVEKSVDAIVLTDQNGMVTEWNTAAKILTGIDRQQALGHPIWNLQFNLAAPDEKQETSLEQVKTQILEFIKLGENAHNNEIYRFAILQSDGSQRYVESVMFNFSIEAGKFLGVINRDVTERHTADLRLRENQRQLSTLMGNLPGIAYRCKNDADWTMEFISQGCLALTGYPPEMLVGNAQLTFNEIIHPDDRNMIRDAIQESIRRKTLYQLNYRITSASGETKWVWEQGQAVYDEKGAVLALEGLITDITDRKKAEVQILRQLETITALYEAATSLASDMDMVTLAQQVTRRCVESFGVKLARLGMDDEQGGLKHLAYYRVGGSTDEQFEQWRKPGFGETPSQRARRSAEAVIIENLQDEAVPENWRNAALQGGYVTSASIPFISRGHPVGSMSLYSDQPGFFNSQKMEFFMAYARMAAMALDNARLLDEANIRLQRVQALRAIDTAINANFDLQMTLNLVIEEATKQLEVDAADIMLLDTGTFTLDYYAGRGFRKTKFPNYALKPGEGLPGRTVLEQRTVFLTDFSDIKHPGEQEVLQKEGFKGYCSAALMVKGKLVGVLEVFHRAEINFSDEWINFMEVLAAQAATAVDNARLFSDLQRSNMDLRMAYDATIEGWSRAMDLRDKETEGHTQRVTQITVRMARAMGLRDDEIAQARRGALLHDIGKMGVPDHILLKPGVLTLEERLIIEKHPQFAKDMLEPIEYLHDAMDIPYAHHERWDGSGYPRGLKGDQIPLVARIFAVIDVWDALVSDRPYRAAWPPKKVVAYIQENAGKLFDPQVVEVFLKMVEELKDISTIPTVE